MGPALCSEMKEERTATSRGGHSRKRAGPIAARVAGAKSQTVDAWIAGQARNDNQGYIRWNRCR
jgi:hypothetical protein